MNGFQLILPLPLFLFLLPCFLHRQALLLIVQSRLNEAEDTLMETLKAVLPHANMMRTLQARQLARYNTRAAPQMSSSPMLQPRTHRQTPAAALTASGSFKANSTVSPEQSVRPSHAGSATQGGMLSSGAKTLAARHRARMSNAAGNDDSGGAASNAGEGGRTKCNSTLLAAGARRQAQLQRPRRTLPQPRIT